MAKKYEFKQDKQGAGFWSKLYLTPKQRLTFLRWFLICALLMVVSVLQDVILCRFQLFGATTDLVPCVIILICVFLGTNSSSLFVLLGSLAYQFSGTSPGYYVIPLITVTAMNLTEDEIPAQTEMLKAPPKPDEKRARLERAMDAIRLKHGKSSLLSANVLGNDLGITGGVVGHDTPEETPADRPRDL